MNNKPVISDRKLVLLGRSLALFDSCWDEAAGMVLME